MSPLILVAILLVERLLLGGQVLLAGGSAGRAE